MVKKKPKLCFVWLSASDVNFRKNISVNSSAAVWLVTFEVAVRGNNEIHY